MSIKSYSSNTKPPQSHIRELTKATVFVGGFPKTANTLIIQQYVEKICKHSEFMLVTDSKNRSRGYVFITFNSKEEANRFVRQEHMFEKKSLDCKISLNHESFITSSLINIREPKKVFVDKIPKNLKKCDVEKMFGKFGEIEEIILIVKEERTINFAYVTYFSSDHAKKCVKQHYFETGEDLKISVIFARPKFSKKMLIGINPILKDYIKNVQKG